MNRNLTTLHIEYFFKLFNDLRFIQVSRKYSDLISSDSFQMNKQTVNNDRVKKMSPTGYIDRHENKQMISHHTKNDDDELSTIWTADADGKVTYDCVDNSINIAQVNFTAIIAKVKEEILTISLYICGE